MRRLAFVIICLVVSLASVGLAAANGSPIKIFLNYLPDVSNYGPQQATGQALVSIGEAWIDLTADGLPRLENERYEVWLVPAGSDRMISMGKFNADANQHVQYHNELPILPQIAYRYLVISVEPEPDDNPTQADPRRSIAGVFPNLELKIISGTPTPTLPPGVTPSPGPPEQLPVTGGSTPIGLWIALILLLALTFIMLVLPTWRQQAVQVALSLLHRRGR